MGSDIVLSHGEFVVYLILAFFAGNVYGIIALIREYFTSEQEIADEEPT